METIISQDKVILEYKTWVSVIHGKNVSSIGDIIWALAARDSIAENWNLLSDEQRKIVLYLDEILKKEKVIVSTVLHAPSSTPQARAEGRWWWFLNEK